MSPGCVSIFFFSFLANQSLIFDFLFFTQIPFLHSNEAQRKPLRTSLRQTNPHCYVTRFLTCLETVSQELNNYSSMVFNTHSLHVESFPCYTCLLAIPICRYQGRSAQSGVESAAGSRKHPNMVPHGTCYESMHILNRVFLSDGAEQREHETLGEEKLLFM